MRTRQILACALAAGTLLAGCGSGDRTTPTTSSIEATEPSFPTPRPSTSRPTPTPSTKTTTSPPAAPPAAQVLPPQESGYVFIETRSGQTRCQLNRQEVDCEAQFTNSPSKDGLPANGVRLTADGDMEWVLGNLGDIPAVTLDYRTYSAVGWTIEADSDGTRFTNDRTGHGMFVSVAKVEAF